MAVFEPTLGATFLGWGTAFRVWAPEANAVEVLIEAACGGATQPHPLAKSLGGYFAATITGVKPGARYAFQVDGHGPYPDPASRYQPQGVHGRSQVVDPSAFLWTDQDWKGLDLAETVLYEIHIGTFTPAGTFQSARKKLPLLCDLGVTAIELMPVADFAGSRNWGYDGVAPFAPARCYGTPDDLRMLVDEAHRLGLAVHLDVVYSHFGPDGAYQGVFSPYYFSAVHRTPLGACINFDGPQSEPVRDYFIENALRWVHEYHIDGLRLEATHAIVDEGVRHVIASIASAVHVYAESAGRRILVIAEDSRNLACIVQPESEGGCGLDAVWSDDFHHQIRRALAGDSDGCSRDFDGLTKSIATTARKGWFYHGQFAPYFGRPRGTDSSGIALSRFVFCLQNHDQVGNRAFGDRLHHAIDAAAYRAASVLLLLLPETPLLFMGQEWAASTPFQYFTDHNPEFGKLARDGRREESRRLFAFTDPALRELIPDPQDIRTFVASRLAWDEREREPHASFLRLYRRLLEIRRTVPRDTQVEITAYDENTLVVERGIRAVVCLRPCEVDLGDRGRAILAETVLTTEDRCYAPDPRPVSRQGPRIRFARAGAVVCR